jgi:hypothetical protein
MLFKRFCADLKLFDHFRSDLSVQVSLADGQHTVRSISGSKRIVSQVSMRSIHILLLLLKWSESFHRAHVSPDRLPMTRMKPEFSTTDEPAPVGTSSRSSAVLQIWVMTSSSATPDEQELIPTVVWRSRIHSRLDYFFLRSLRLFAAILLTLVPRLPLVRFPV